MDYGSFFFVLGFYWLMILNGLEESVLAVLGLANNLLGFGVVDVASLFVEEVVSTFDGDLLDFHLFAI